MLFRSPGPCAGFRLRGRLHACMLWLAIVAVLSAPLGATLHAMTHLETAVAASHDTALPASDTDGRLHHCHDCSMWKALGCLLSVQPPALPSVDTGNSYFSSFERSIDIAGVRWFMQRAPPHA